MKIAYLKQFDNMYYVTDLGDVFSVDRTYTNNTKMYKRIVKGKKLSQSTDKDGYHFVRLSYPKHNNYRVHRLILMAFKPLQNYNAFQVNHINNLKNDNRLQNLEWVNASENIKHAYLVGAKSATGSRNGRSVLVEKQVREIKSLLKQNLSPKQIAKLYNVAITTIKSIKNGYNWTHVD